MAAMVRAEIERGAHRRLRAPNAPTRRRVQTDETRTSHVHVTFEEFIEELYVDYIGKTVKKGQPLFKIYSRDLLAAEQEYLSSRAALGRIPPGASTKPARAATRDLTAAGSS